MASRFLAFTASRWWCHLLKWEGMEDCHVWGTGHGCVALGLRGEVCGWGRVGELVATAHRWATTTRSTWPSSILACSRRHREKSRLWAPPPRTKAEVGYTSHGSTQERHHTSVKCVLLNQAQSPSITGSFPRAHTVDVQAATRVPLLPWRLTQGFCAKKMVLVLLQAPR